MIDIEGMNITISRGDCSPFTITFTGDDVPEDGTVSKISGTADDYLLTLS